MLWIRKILVRIRILLNFFYFSIFWRFTFDPDSNPYPDENLISSNKKQCYGSAKFWSGSGSCKNFSIFSFFWHFTFDPDWDPVPDSNPEPGGTKTSDNTNPDPQHSKKRYKSWNIFFLLHSSLKITWIYVSVAVSTLGRRIHVDHHLVLGPLPDPPASNSRGGRAGLLLLAALTRGVAVPVVRISVAVIKEVGVLLLQLLLDVDQGQIGPLPVKKSMLFHYPVHFTRSETNARYSTHGPKWLWSTC